MPLFLRTTENAMPAITTELDFTTEDLLRYMIQTGKFRDDNGTISEARVDAAKAYLKTDWDLLRKERWSGPRGFDPEHPFIDKNDPNWRDDPEKVKGLEVYLPLKDAMEEQKKTFMDGPNDEYTKAQYSLIMLQRVDLWCAGPSEVEAAVKHLARLGEKFNRLEPEFPEFITEFYAGAPDL